MDNKKIISPAEAAAYCGVITKKTLDEWRSEYNRTGRNRGPKFIKLGGKVGYSSRKSSS